MAGESVTAPAVYQLDPQARARILAETPLAQAMREIEAERQAFMLLNDGCPFGAAPASQDSENALAPSEDN